MLITHSSHIYRWKLNVVLKLDWISCPVCCRSSWSCQSAAWTRDLWERLLVPGTRTLALWLAKWEPLCIRLTGMWKFWKLKLWRLFYLHVRLAVICGVEGYNVILEDSTAAHGSVSSANARGRIDESEVDITSRVLQPQLINARLRNLVVVLAPPPPKLHF